MVTNPVFVCEYLNAFVADVNEMPVFLSGVKMAGSIVVPASPTMTVLLSGRIGQDPPVVSGSYGVDVLVNGFIKTVDSYERVVKNDLFQFFPNAANSMTLNYVQNADNSFAWSTSSMIAINRVLLGLVGRRVKELRMKAIIYYAIPF